LAPIAAIAGAAIWILIFWFTRYVSVASMAAAAALPLIILATTWLSGTAGKSLFYSSVCLAAVVIWRHRSNFSRLMHGTEPRFTRK
jgi:glycerol-3-phosphate acyltransferase PlsY